MVYPIGTKSSAETPVASFGPELDIVNSKVIVSPMFGVELLVPLIPFINSKSASKISNVSESSSSSLWSPSSLPGSLSGSSKSLPVT